jgi:3-phosphoshikimate 1-carboxyvinyltransferase
MPQQFTSNQGGVIRGEIRVPSDKSISHRAAMLGSIAAGTTHIEHFLAAGDTLATLNILRALGVSISGPDNGKVTIHGIGTQGSPAHQTILKTPSHPLDCGNSGTSIRLLMGLLAWQGIQITLTGDSSLLKRPMLRVATPLQQMGAHIELLPGGFAPVTLFPSADLKGMTYELPIASAQVKSALLLAGIGAKGKTTLIEPIPTRDHTERMLKSFGYPLEKQGSKIIIEGNHPLIATTIQVPADISSAAFFMVGASIAPHSDILLKEVGINPTRTGVIDILKRMGADITLLNQRQFGDEPVANIRVRYAPLHGITIPPEWVSLAIDEFPTIFIAAANAKGKTILTGAEELRVKESDRLQSMALGLNTIGVNAETTADGIVIEGGEYNGGVIESHGDHRIAMAFAVSALRAKNPILIHEWDNVATSFPNFIDLIQQCGMKGTLQKTR